LARSEATARELRQQKVEVDGEGVAGGGDGRKIILLELTWGGRTTATRTPKKTPAAAKTATKLIR
jgi:hypothetical protein